MSETKAINKDSKPKISLQKSQIMEKLRNFRELNLIIIIAVIFVIMSFASPYFLTWENIEAILLSFTTNGIVVIGMTVMLIVGGIDVSVGYTMCLAMCISGALFLEGWSPWLAGLVGFATTAVIGLTIGFFVTKVKLNHLITTLSMMGILRGLCYIITKGTPLSLYHLPDDFKFMGVGKIFGIPFAIILFFIIAIICDFLIRRSTLIRIVFYVGSNEKAAMFSGINVDKIKIFVAVLCSSLAGLAGVIYMARFTSATPTFGQGLEMTAISAAVIGGASLTGGKGTVLGAVLGITLLQLVTSSMILLNVNPYWQVFITGLILLTAISLDSLGQMRKNKIKYSLVSTSAAPPASIEPGEDNKQSGQASL